jgi:hypothetical protein
MSTDGAVVLAFPGAGHASVAAACLAVPLTSAAREVVLAAPLIAASWARSVAAAARADGADIRAEPVVTPDLVGVTAEVVRAERDSLRAFPAWFDASVKTPEPEALGQLRAQCLTRLSPAELRSDDVRRALFGDQHRYGVSHAERAARVRELRAEELGAATAVLLRAPPILATSAPAASTPAASTPAVPASVAAGTAARKRGVVRIAGDRAFYLVGVPGVALGSEAKFPLHVAWAMLGGREGMLDRRLRREHALTYSLAAFSREFAEGGYGMFFAGCRPEVLGKLASEVKGVLEHLRDGEIDSALLRSAKERLIIQQYRALQTERGLAERLCGYQVAGLGPACVAAYPERIATVTAEDVQAAAAAFLAPGSLLETRMVPAGPD